MCTMLRNMNVANLLEEQENNGQQAHAATGTEATALGNTPTSYQSDMYNSANLNLLNNNIVQNSTNNDKNDKKNNDGEEGEEEDLIEMHGSPSHADYLAQQDIHEARFTSMEKYIPIKFEEPIERAAESGSFKLMNVVLDRILKETTLKRIDIANATPFGDQTILEKVAECGHVDLFHSLLEYGYATTDKEKRRHAKERLLANSSTKAEDRTSASELQLLATMEAVMTLKDKHTLAYNYYHVRHFYVMFLPSTVMSAAAATLAFLSTAKALEQYAVKLVVVVGVLSSLSALLQSISDQVQFNAKALQHKSAAHELDGLLQLLTFNAIGSLNTTSGATPFSDQELKTIKKQVLSIEQTCQSILPQAMDSLYDQVKDEYSAIRQEAAEKAHYENGKTHAAELSLQDVVMVTQEILNYRYWPWHVDTKLVASRVAKRIRLKSIELIGGRAEEIDDSIIGKSIINSTKVGPSNSGGGLEEGRGGGGGSNSIGFESPAFKVLVTPNKITTSTRKLFDEDNREMDHMYGNDSAGVASRAQMDQVMVPHTTSLFQILVLYFRNKGAHEKQLHEITETRKQHMVAQAALTAPAGRGFRAHNIQK